MTDHTTSANAETQQALHTLISDDAYAITFQSVGQYRAALLRNKAPAAIPLMTDPLGRHWRQPNDIRQAPMDDTHVLLTSRQVEELSDYSRSYPSGTYDGKCWKREGQDCWYLCWYEPHSQPGKIGIGFRIILEADIKRAAQLDGNQGDVR